MPDDSESEWRAKAHHYRGLATLTGSRMVRDLLLQLAYEADSIADDLPRRSDEPMRRTG
jgi:hypothetical protein